jgi:hypothetical protein
MSDERRGYMSWNRQTGNMLTTKMFKSIKKETTFNQRPKSLTTISMDIYLISPVKAPLATL